MGKVAADSPVMQIWKFQSFKFFEFSISIFEIRICARKILSLATALITLSCCQYQRNIMLYLKWQLPL